MGHWSGEGGREGASPLPTDSKGRRGRGLSYWATRLGLPGHVNTTVPSPINLSTTGGCWASPVAHAAYPRLPVPPADVNSCLLSARP